MPRKTKEERAAELQTEIATIKATQQRFVEMLLSGRTISEACRVLQIGRRTATYWMKADSFVRFAYEHERLRLATEFRERLCKLQDMALSALEESLQQKEDPALRAAVAKFIYTVHLADYKLSPLHSADDMVEGVIHSIPDARMKSLHGQAVEYKDIPDDF